MSITKKVVLTLLIILVLLIGSITGYIYFKLNSTSKEIEKTGVTNILLLGTDGREKEAAYRSDCMMILTIDSTHKSVKVTSLARDTYVKIPGQGYGKLNASYFWGKEQLLFKTLKNEFDIDIDKFVQVDFDGLIKVIDTIGGIQVNITEKEKEGVNQLIPTIYAAYENKDKGELKLIPGDGKQTLNGYQAISYCRIRYIDNAIYRDARQRKVIFAIASKIMQMPVSKYADLIKSLIPCVSLNMGKVEILALANTTKEILAEGNGIKEGEFPIIDEVHSKGGIYKNAGWVWLYDKNSVVVLKEFIFDDIDMENNKYLNDNSKIELNY